MLELRQELKLTQQLVMTPQLQQAIKLLQLGRLELVGLVQKELEENPVLEETPDVDDSLSSTESRELEGAGDLGDTIAEIQSDFALSGESAGIDQTTAEIAADLAAVAAEPTPELEPSHADKVADIDWDSYMEAYPQTGMREVRDDDDRQSFENTPTRRETLSEFLRSQLQMLDLTDEQQSIAYFILGNLDERGYLMATTEEIARRLNVAEEAVEVTLEIIQSLDPAGVAARDLRECLLIQARMCNITDPIALRILDQSLDALIKRDFRGVARVLGISIEEVAAAAAVIGTLQPRPGGAFGGDETIYIVPDIYVHKIGDEFHVVLNDDGLPRLRVSAMYRQVLGQGELAAKETKNYVHEKVRSATWLIKSIHQRQRTIYKVMQSIIRYQRDFFEKGINYLRPLNLRDVADDIEMHESTVSRVTSNKYVHTPQGIFELKYFFNSSISRFDGASVASESVKKRIGKLIGSEDPRRPLSDQRIAEMLKVANINIARRTVTKYRESLNILSSTKRRQVG